LILGLGKTASFALAGRDSPGFETVSRPDIGINRLAPCGIAQINRLGQILA
jgi:hypothetical protein